MADMQNLPTQTLLMETSQKRGKILIKTDDKNNKIYGDDFNYFSSTKSYNLAMP